MLNLEKAYDKVDRKQLLQSLAEWIENEVLHMVRVTFGVFVVRTRGDQTSYVAKLTRSVAQDTPSSPVRELNCERGATADRCGIW